METRATASLTLRLLGGFELSNAEGVDLAPPGRKLRALIACLALPPGVARSRERLTCLLWGDRADEQARGSLRQALSDLRHGLGEPTPLMADRETVAIDPAYVTVDAVEFERLAKAGELERAAELYRGDLLDGVSVPDTGFEDWLLVERTRFHDLAVQVLTDLVRKQSGGDAITTATRLLQLEPDREATHRELMRLYAAQGERAKALRQYLACRDLLRAEFGVEPEPETTNLFEKIRSSTTSIPSHDLISAELAAALEELRNVKRILWVDDRPENNALEREIFEALGIRCVLSSSTEGALHLIRHYVAARERFPIHAIISDMGRPPDPRAGYTLLAKVRAMQLSIPYFIYAGSRAPEHIAEARDRGAQGTTNRAVELLDMVLSALNLR